MVSLWEGKVIRGSAEYQALTDSRNCVKTCRSAGPPAALFKAKTEALLRLPDSCLQVFESIWHHHNYLYTQLYLMMIKVANARVRAHRRHPVIMETLKAMIIRR